MLNETPLVKAHQSMGAKLVDFGGWNMPLHYGSQVEEHHHVRQHAGMFDVSHMTVVDITGADAKAFLQYLLANDVGKLAQPGKALYSAMLNAEGGVIDDLIVYLMEQGYRLVVNCATRDKDLAWMNEQASTYEVAVDERAELAMIAVQGPQARLLADGVLSAPQTADLAVFQGALLENEYFIARTGYTGEDGYEIMLPANEAEMLWRALADAGVKPCGLGARDTLRLEAGMNLYGHEMDENISPLVANMAWTVALEPEWRNFIGRNVIATEKQAGVQEKLVGLVLLDKGVLRAGQAVVMSEKNIETANTRGIITSGTFSPTLGKSIALARVPKTDAANTGEICQVEVRNKVLNAKIVKPCFVRHGKSVID